MQARWLRLTVRDSRTPTTRTQKLSRRLLRNDRCPCRARRRAAVTSLFIRTPIRSQTNRKFYAPVSLLPENVVYRAAPDKALLLRLKRVIELEQVGFCPFARDAPGRRQIGQHLVQFQGTL